jgi:hypothetical protein
MNYRETEFIFDAEEGNGVVAIPCVYVRLGVLLFLFY